MEIFVESVKNDEFQLDSLDISISTTYIPFYYWYQNVDRQSWDAFMPAETMEKAFYMTLCEFPLLAGNIVGNSNGKILVKVEKGKLNMPIYSDITCDVEFETIRDSGFNIKLLGNTHEHARDVPAPSSLFGGKMKLTEAHIIRLKNFSGVCLLVSVAHFLFDAVGFTSFVKRWAEITRFLLTPNDEVGHVLCKRQYIHDRSFLSQFWDIGVDRLDDLACKVLNKGNGFTRWAAWLSPEARGRVFKYLASLEKRARCHFRIRKKDIDALRATIQKHSLDGMQFSTNDALTAIIATALFQSMKDVDSDKRARYISSIRRSLLGKGDEPAEAILAVAISLRPRTNRQDVYAYTGNMALPMCTAVPLNLVKADPEPKSLAGIAKYVRNMVNMADAKYIGQYTNLINKEPDGFMRQVNGLSKYRHRLIVSNQISFNHYDVDFGVGIPVLVRLAIISFPHSAFIMPSRPGDDGYEITMTLTADVASKLVQNTHWMNIVDSYDFDV